MTRKILRATSIVVALLFGSAAGCSPSAKNHMAGSLIFVDGNQVSTLDLATGKVRRVTSWESTLCSEGVTRMGAGAVLTTVSAMGPEPDLVRCDEVSGDTVRIGTGTYATALSDTGPVLWYDGRTGTRDTQSCLFIGGPHSHRGRPEVIALGPRSWDRGPNGVLHWRYDVENPVVMDSSRVAFVGAGDSVMSFDSVTGRVRSLGQVGVVPILWLSRSRKLVCIQSWHGDRTFQFTPGEARLERVPGLDGPCGWASVGGGDSILFCRSSSRWFTFEANDVLLYDGTSRRVRLYAPNVVVFGHSIYNAR